MQNRQVALITGASRGIGKAIAHSLHKAGCSICIAYQKNKTLADKIVDEIISDSGDAISVQMNVQSRESVKSAIHIIQKKYSKIDVLINNAAIAQEKSFETISDDDWHQILSINLQGPFICSQEVLPFMISQRFGRIINITSIGGQWGGYNQVHYAASKAGLISLTRSLARIYSKDGITANAIAPGLVQTDMSENELQSEVGQEKIKKIPIGRIAQAKEIADVAVFLASDEASYITGQTINVNGGMYFG